MIAVPLLRSLPHHQVRVTDPFWSRWREVVAQVSLPGQYEQLEQTGRLEHFRRAAQRLVGGFTGFYFNESDVYKWLEAAAYVLDEVPSSGLRTQFDEAIGLVAAAQEEDGYLNTFFQLNHPKLKWRNLGSMHEMYCAGHLFEAAAAAHDCLRDDRLLSVACKLADHIAARFGPGKKLGYCGHEEIELGLLRLAEAANRPDYADLARWMIDVRGSRPSPFDLELDDAEAMTISSFAAHMLRKDGKYSGEYAQDHLPVREQSDVVGHAVRAMYLYAAAAEVADAELTAALHRAWNNLVGRRMYITGGIGPSHANEGFSVDYDLPNFSAYAETCAACGLIFWANGMLHRTGNSDFVDTMERGLYNGAISGISLDGSTYFYTNPLESRGNHKRTPWFSCACCPPNIARLIGSIGRYLASVDDDGFYLNIPAGLEAEFEVKGVKVKLTVESNYPWSGNVKVRVEPTRPVIFALRVRIPDWADDVQTDLPDQESDSEFESGYAVFRKTWRSGDVLTLDFEMDAKWVEANPKVRENLGRVALTRGPIVYCAESVDLKFPPQLFCVDPELPILAEPKSALHGMIDLAVEGLAQTEDFPDALYADAGSIALRPVTARFIPYFAWANRGASDMQVWFRQA